MSRDEPILVVEGLEKRFPGSTTAVHPLSFSVEGGTFLGLVGPDGAGKTTLLRLVAGLLQPTTGTIRVCGHDPFRETAAVRNILAYMPQRFGLYEDLTVRENLDFNADLRGVTGPQREESFSRLLDFTGLDPFQKRRAGALSGGMKQKLGLACALLAKPRLLLLDEPSVGVDPISRRELWKMVDTLVAEGMAVIWSTAYLDEAEICREVLLLNEGQCLFSGPPDELTVQIGRRAYSTPPLESGRRRLLARLLDHEAVTDGVIEGARLRVVLAEERTPQDVADVLPEDTGLTPAEPRFEDAFIDLLGGGPGGSSVIAERFPERGRAGDAAVIEARNLSKQYGDFFATREVTFTIGRGEIFGLLGPNGAGKSTTFKMMCGLARPTAGDALVLGMSLAAAGGRARRRIGYMAQKFSLYGNLTVGQNLRFFSGAYGLAGKSGRDQVSMMVEIFGLDRFLRESPDGLPLGYKQRLALACALMHQPEILFLDEPTSGVDPVTRREFWTHIYGLTARGVTVMVTTHFMDEAEYCDRIGLMNHGELIALGTPDELKQEAATEETPEPSMEEAFIGLIRRRQEDSAKEAA